MKDTATIDNPLVFVGPFLNPQSQIAVKLTDEAVMDVARSHILAVFSEEGAVINGECHRHCRFVDSYARQRFGMLEISDSVTDLKSFNSDKSANIAAFDTLHTLAAHPLEHMKFLYFLTDNRTVFLAKSYVGAFAKLATMDASHGDTSHIAAEIKRSHKHLRRTFDRLRFGDIFDYRIKNRSYVIGRLVPVGAHPALLRRSIDCREVELIFSSVEIAHQIEHHFLHFVGTAIRFIHLIYYDDRFEAHLNGFLKHETCLGHGTFESINQKKASVGHVQHTLNLATEVGVSRSVDYIYLIVLIVDRDVFGQNSYSTFTFKIVVVKNKFAGILILTKKVSGQKHFVNQRGFTMVHVGNNSYISDFLHNFFIFGCKFSCFFLKSTYKFREFCLTLP